MNERQKFWSRVDASGDCWLWTGNRNHKGYGNVSVHSSDRHTTEKAHRVSWRLFNGCIPDGLLVCHSCDMPPCVNPAHLFLATHKENMADMTRKGRRGISLRHRKLTYQQVLAIRRIKTTKSISNQVIADAYGIHVGHVKLLARGDGWKHGEASE